ncbi:MAG: hypothetical protein K2P93_06785 [Alphaproteobacteria bacterium]|nr:hypothetical protein [Alphaproteobacteria bacterium]
MAILPCFDLIHNQPIIKPSPDWEPIFSPQVTIQHPLEYSIPLYFGLFGFKDASTMMPFMASLPLRNVFVRLREEANSGDLRQLMGKYGSKIFGLTFLHAMTLVSITPNQDCDDRTYLEETHKSLTGYYQIDAKMKLKLMSRRPFSSMFRELDTKIDYTAFFGQAMCYNPHGCSNTGFVHFYNVPFLFHKANYAEQFFDSATGKIRTLSHLLPLFQDEFVAKNALILSQLLEKGVISTAMLRNLKEQHDPDSLLPTLNDSGNNFEKIPGE